VSTNPYAKTNHNTKGLGERVAFHKAKKASSVSVAAHSWFVISLSPKKKKKKNHWGREAGREVGVDFEDEVKLNENWDDDQ